MAGTSASGGEKASRVVAKFEIYANSPLRRPSFLPILAPPPSPPRLSAFFFSAPAPVADHGFYLSQESPPRPPPQSSPHTPFLQFAERDDDVDDVEDDDNDDAGTGHFFGAFF